MVFFDLSNEQSLRHHNGRTLRPTELVEVFAARCGSVDRQRMLHSLQSFHPLALDRPRRWEDAVTVGIGALTACRPSKHELSYGREILDLLPKSYRRNLMSSDVVGLVAPLLAVATFNRRRDGGADANRPDDGVATLRYLLDAKNPKAVSVLCANRESARPGSGMLQENINEGRARRALSAAAVLVANSRAAHGEVCIYLQTGTVKALRTLFPSMVMAYAEAGELSRMYDSLDGHFRTIERLASEYAHTDVSVRAKPLDFLTVETDEAVDEAFRGAKERDYSSLISRGFDREARALPAAIKAVTRLMPEVRSKSRGFVSEALCFPSRYERAVFEVFFYRQLAKLASREQAFWFGLERDWSSYQRQAWECGFAGPLASPLLFARRSDHRVGETRLCAISIRQFWR